MQSPVFVPESEILRRRDVRDLLTFTIDPADAKDFDDALSFTKQEDGTFLIGVHIADVSHYVLPGDKIDNDAYERGTSIYYVDHVDPMLPEKLCNNLCSLRPNEDKLCMSVIFTIGPDATIYKYKVCRTVIRSDFRLTYDEVQAILDHVADVKPLSSHSQATPELVEALTTINNLAKKLRTQRMAAGALETT